MILVEKAQRFLASQKEAGEQVPLSTADKATRLLKLIKMDDFGIQITEHGPYALVPFTDARMRSEMFVVSDGEDTPQDRAQIKAHIDELRLDERYENVNFIDVDPRGFLAQLSTNGRYVGFHDKMGFAIMGITGLAKRYPFARTNNYVPNFRRIDTVLIKAGFENIGKNIGE